MKELTTLLILLIIIFIYINFIRKNIYLDLVESKINNKKYYVRKLSDSQEAADKLAILSQDLMNLVNHIQNKDREGISKLIKNFNPDSITENIPGSMYTAYSVNKGEEISICVREKNTEKNTETFIDRNTINFVAIHELSHIMTNEVGHTPKFWDNMKFLLEQGIEIGIYTPIDYSSNPVIYCGEEITSTPLHL